MKCEGTSTMEHYSFAVSESVHKREDERDCAIAETVAERCDS